MAFLQLYVKAALLQLNTQVPIPLAFTKLLESFESCPETVEKLGGFLQEKLSPDYSDYMQLI